MQVIEFIGGNPEIGLVARKDTPGPEADLVKAFRPFIPDCFRWRSGDIALFHEPQMETGFPDLVIVQYTRDSFSTWPKARLLIKPIDLKIMHHLMRVKYADSPTLCRVLGISTRLLEKSLKRLLNANMIVSSSSSWKPRPRRHVFGVRAIVAVEAKIKNWSEAFHQSLLNQWFASQSYVLSPIEKPQTKILERSDSSGVGILLLNGSRVRMASYARKYQIPVSFGSWLFNEWVGRCLHHM